MNTTQAVDLNEYESVLREVCKFDTATAHSWAKMWLKNKRGSLAELREHCNRMMETATIQTKRIEDYIKAHSDITPDAVDMLATKWYENYDELDDFSQADLDNLLKKLSSIADGVIDRGTVSTYLQNVLHWGFFENAE